MNPTNFPYPNSNDLSFNARMTEAISSLKDCIEVGVVLIEFDDGTKRNNPQTACGVGMLLVDPLDFSRAGWMIFDSHSDRPHLCFFSILNLLTALGREVFIIDWLDTLGRRDSPSNSLRWDRYDPTAEFPVRECCLSSVLNIPDLKKWMPSLPDSVHEQIMYAYAAHQKAMHPNDPIKQNRSREERLSPYDASGSSNANLLRELVKKVHGDRFA